MEINEEENYESDSEFFYKVLGGKEIPSSIYKNLFIDGWEWHFCEICESSTIICTKCRNNCCNAGNGKMFIDGGRPTRRQQIENILENLVDCDFCDKCYEYQDICWKNKSAPSLHDFEIEKVFNVELNKYENIK